MWVEDPLPVDLKPREISMRERRAQPTERRTMIFIGIDPGVSGGIAVVDEVGQIIGTPVKLSALTDLDVLDTLVRIRDAYCRRGVRAVIEKAQASPQMGTVSAFTYGRGYGALRMALLAAGIPFDEVTSPVWQGVMQCRSKGDKNVTKRRAQQLYPWVTVTHAIADALLIAEFARRLERRSGDGEASDHAEGERHGKEGSKEVRQGQGGEVRKVEGAQANAPTGRRRPPAWADSDASQGSDASRHGRHAGQGTGAAGVRSR